MRVIGCMTANRTAIFSAAVAAIVLLLAFHARPEPQSAAPQHPIKSSIRPNFATIDPLRDAAPQAALSLGAHRNLFTFNDTPPPVPHVVHHTVIAPPQITIAPSAQQPQAEAAPAPPALPYRCIGRFGPDSAPFIALANDDHEVINVRAGETVGGRFIVRSIGLESVDIGFTGFPSSYDKRIAIGH